MKEFLAIFGALALLAIVIGILIALWYVFADWIDRLKIRYRYKHRFDKPPTAKCYCVDCKYHNNETGQCYRFGETTKEYRCTADCWFCWEATPCEK